MQKISNKYYSKIIRVDRAIFAACKYLFLDYTFKLALQKYVTIFDNSLPFTNMYQPYLTRFKFQEACHI